MNFSPDIKEEALSILNKPNVVLPAGIKVGQADPVFFVSEIDDLSIYAHLTIEHEGKIYKSEQKSPCRCCSRRTATGTSCISMLAC